MITVQLSEEQILQLGNDADLGALARSLYYDQKESRVKIIDPPGGWRYGFPKPIPEDVTNVTEWLVENGYPQKEIDDFKNDFMYRYWYEPKKQSS